MDTETIREIVSVSNQDITHDTTVHEDKPQNQQKVNILQHAIIKPAAPQVLTYPQKRHRPTKLNRFQSFYKRFSDGLIVQKRQRRKRILLTYHQY